MATLTMGGVTWTYTYDANGMRTSRSNGTTTYNYVYTGDKLTRMTIVTTGSTQTVDISYDASGTPLTLTYTPNGSTTGTTYYYVTNIQGDVTGLTDTTGELIISYFYTGYGETYTIKHNTEQGNILSAVNPLCYRGYVLDTQTKLYYLQSRYYDYTHGRFINTDALVSTGQELLCKNMFAYCLNNPVKYSDPGGMSSHNSVQPWLCECANCKTSTQVVYHYGNNTSLNLYDFLTHMARTRDDGNTFSVGVSLSSSFYGVTNGISGCISVDSSNSYALQYTNSNGPSIGSGADIGIVFTYTNAQYVTDLAGTSVSTGGTLTVLGGITIDYITFEPASNPGTTCWGISVAINGGASIDGHQTYNYTESTKPWNLWTAIRDLFYA